MAKVSLYFTDIRHPEGSAGVISRFLIGSQRHTAVVIELDDGTVRVFRAGPFPISGQPDQLVAELRSYSSLAAAMEFDADVRGALGVQEVGTLTAAEATGYVAALDALRLDMNSRGIEYSAFSANSNMAAYMGCLTGSLVCDTLPLDSTTGNQINAFGWGGLLPTFDADQFAAHQPILNADGSYSVGIGSDLFTYNLPGGWNRVEHADGTRYEAREDAGSVTTAVDVRILDAAGELQYSADYLKSFIGTRDVAVTETYYENGALRTSVHTTFSGTGDDFTQTVSRDGTEVRFGLNEEGESVVTAVTAVDGVALSAEDSARVAEALRNAGVRPEHVIDGAPLEGLPHVDLDFDEQAGDWEVELSFDDDDAFAIEYLIRDDGVLIADDVVVAGVPLPEEYEPLFDFFAVPGSPFSVLDPDAVDVDVVDATEFFFDLEVQEGITLELHYIDGAIEGALEGDIPGVGHYTSSVTYYPGGAADGETTFPQGWLREAINAARTKSAFIAEWNGGHTEGFVTNEGGLRIYSRETDANGELVRLEVDYPDGGQYLENHFAGFDFTVLAFNDAGDFIDNSRMDLSSDPSVQSASARAFGYEVGYTFFGNGDFSHITATDFEDRQTAFSFSDEHIHRDLHSVIDGYTTYSDSWSAGVDLPISLRVQSEEGWDWGESRFGERGRTFAQTNPAGERWSWYYDDTGHGQFSYGSGGPAQGGFVDSDGVGFSFYIIEHDSEGNSFRVPVPFGYTGDHPSHGFDLARRPQPIEEIQPFVEHDFTTVAVRDSMAFAPLVSADDWDGDNIVAYELTQTGRRADGAFLTFADAPPLPDDAVMQISASQLDQVLLHGGGTRGMDQFWARAYDGELWGPWAPIGVRTASAAGPAVTQTLFEIDRADAEDMSLFFSAVDPQREEVEVFEFQDLTVGAGTAFLEFFGYDVPAQKIHMVMADDIDGLQLVGGLQNGQDAIRVRAFAGESWGEWVTLLVQTGGNRAPELLQATADQVISEDAAFSLSVAQAFSDPDSDTLTFSTGPLPDWLSFADGVFSGTPLNADVGTYQLQVSASDGEESAVDTFRITVENTNDAPRLGVAAPAAIALEDAAFVFTIPASAVIDEDEGDVLTWSASSADGDALPGWLEFDPESRSFAGTPSNDDVGTLALRVTAADREHAVSFAFGVTVENTNDAPLASGILANAAATEDQPFSLALPDGAFSDVDAGDSLAYSATLAGGAPLPAWLAFAGGAFTGTPLNGDVGSYDVRVRATDEAGEFAEQSLTITAANTNDAPTVATPPAEQSFDAGSAFSFALPAGTFADEDAGDTLGLSAALADGGALPSWLSFNAADGTFSGNPGSRDFGAFNVAVTATDAAGASVASSFGLFLRAPAGTSASGAAGDDALYGGAGNETLSARGGDDYLNGDLGDDLLRGGTGNDALQGGDGTDTIRGGTGQNLLDGGAGDDTIHAGSGSSLIVGGQGNDTIRTGRGSDVIVFNRGDGSDILIGDGGGDNTLSLGGGIRYSDLSLSRSGRDLVLNTGGSDRVVLKDWYAGKQSIGALQIVLDDYDPDSPDPLRNRQVQAFDFLGMARAFDQATRPRALTSWDLSNALLQFHLSGSDDMALGGDLAYWYARNRSLAGISVQAAQQVIGAAGFGSDAQTLRPFTGLQDGFVKLS